MRKILFLMIVCFSVYFITGCGKGIEPEPEKIITGQTGFSGKVTFTGNWPAGIKRTHVVVFKNELADSTYFLPPNLAFVIDSISYRSQEYVYNSVENNFIPLFQLVAGDYKYIVVAQSKTPEISLDRKDWVIVGVYNIGGDQSKPKTLTIQDGEIIPDVDIIVDFNNPPPQPPM